MEERVQQIIASLESVGAVLYDDINDVNDKELKTAELIYVSKQDGDMTTLAEVFPAEHFDQLRDALRQNSKMLKFAVLRSQIELVLIKLLSPAEFKVYAYLRATMGKYNYVHESRVRPLSTAIGASTKTVAKALKTLRECNILYGHEDKHGNTIERINPAAAWNGPLNHGIKAPPIQWQS